MQLPMDHELGEDEKKDPLDDDGSGDAFADAHERLTNAAPMLLAAAKKVLEYSGSCHAVYCELQAAVNAAEGKAL